MRPLSILFRILAYAEPQSGEFGGDRIAFASNYARARKEWEALYRICAGRTLALPPAESVCSCLDKKVEPIDVTVLRRRPS
jgi:hypothetical protein